MHGLLADIRREVQNDLYETKVSVQGVKLGDWEAMKLESCCWLSARRW